MKQGAGSLTEAQLLAIILRTGSGKQGVLNLAIELLQRFKSLNDLDAASPRDLSSVKGLGTAKIAQIKAAFELGKRLMAESRDGQVFSSSQAVYAHCAPR